MDQTFSIIKPDATKRNITGGINKVIEESGLRIIAQKRIKLTNEQAENFYSVHKDKPFFIEVNSTPGLVGIEATLSKAASKPLVKDKKISITNEILKTYMDRNNWRIDNDN